MQILLIALTAITSWLALDSDAPITPEEVDQFQMAILHPYDHPDLKKIDQWLLLSKVHLGLVKTSDKIWPHAEGKEWIIGPRPGHEGEYYVDLRNPDWQELVLKEQIPAIVEQGFDGLALLAIDTISELQIQDPMKYGGMAAAMIAFIIRIRETFPELKLISHTSRAILDRVAPSLDGLLVKGLYGALEDGKLVPVSAKERWYTLQVVRPLAQQYGLPMFDLEYLPAEQSKEIAEASRAMGMVPYIAHGPLDRVYPQG